jgi:hypothetical protein
MEKSIVAEIANLIATLSAAGKTGFLILLVGMILILILVAATVVYQRIVIRRFESSSKATQDHVKALEVVLKQREVGIKERDELRDTFTQQFSLVKDTNDELRSELERLGKQQQGLETSINRTISVGLENILSRLQKTTFKDMVAEIPESLKNDLLKAVNEAADEAAHRALDLLMGKGGEKGDRLGRRIVQLADEAANKALSRLELMLREGGAIEQHFAVMLRQGGPIEQHVEQFVRQNATLAQEMEQLLRHIEQMMHQGDALEQRFEQAVRERMTHMLSLAIQEASEDVNLDHRKRDQLVSLTFRYFEKYWPILFRQPIGSVIGPSPDHR